MKNVFTAIYVVESTISPLFEKFFIKTPALHDIKFQGAIPIYNLELATWCGTGKEGKLLGLKLQSINRECYEHEGISN